VFYPIGKRSLDYGCGIAQRQAAQSRSPQEFGLSVFGIHYSVAHQSTCRKRRTIQSSIAPALFCDCHLPA
jgi:hypothetical protein